jgi:beta-glucosidase
MGQEFYDLGVHVALAPVTGGPLGRAARGGRNWEGNSIGSSMIKLHVNRDPFSMIGWYADPYATGEASYLSVKGIQDAGVQACSK